LDSAAGIARAVREGSRSARDVVEQCLARIARLQPKLNAFVTVCEDAALAQADAVDRARREVIQALRSPLWVLATLGAVMPFVGLFGTVVGILGSFRQIGITGQSGFAVVAPAISEALITTAGGIAVAVEAVIFFNVFQARISKEAFDLTLRADELTEVVIDHASEISAAMQAPRASAAAPVESGRAAIAQGHA